MLQAANSHLTANVSSLTSEIDALNQSLADQQALVDAAEADCERLYVEVARRRRDDRFETEKLHALLQNSRTREVAVAAENSGLRRKVEKFQRRSEQLESANRELTAANAVLASERHAADAEVRALQSEANALRVQIDKLRSQNSQLEVLGDVLREELRQTRARHDADVANFSKTLTEAAAEIDAAQSRNQSMQDANASLCREVASTQHKYDQLQDEYDAMKVRCVCGCFAGNHTRLCVCVCVFVCLSFSLRVCVRALARMRICVRLLRQIPCLRRVTRVMPVQSLHTRHTEQTDGRCTKTHWRTKNLSAKVAWRR